MGRATQQVGVMASPAGNDIVQIFEYDELERKAKEYLPYTDLSNDGKLRESAITELQTFYLTNLDGADDIYPFAEKEYDYSPLSKVKQQSAPGDTWHKSKEHLIEYSYITNDVEIDKWIVDINGDCIKNATSHTVNSLYKTGTKDENDIWNYEYKEAWFTFFTFFYEL